MSNALLPGPLEVAEVNRPPRQRDQHDGYEDGSGGENDINDDYVIVAVIVGVLDRTGDDTDYDVHAARWLDDETRTCMYAKNLRIVRGNFNRISRSES